jgi:ABC-type multidrug transport system fused ATPase/permease subunit
MDGHLIDGGETVSVFSKYSFSWCRPLLLLARKKGTLDLEDLPGPDHKSRARDVTQGWLRANRTGPLWIRIALHHKWALTLQWTLTLGQAFGNFAPQFVLLNLLRLLEKREVGKSIGPEAWIWVVGLGLTTVVASWIEAWLFWISQADLTIPVRAELSSLIFQKAMRRKDVKGASAKPNKAVESTHDEAPKTVDVEAAPEGGSAEAAKPKAEDGEETLTKQTTINLIGVDGVRVSSFLSYNNYFIGSVWKLIVSFGFLLSLIGWQSLLAGLSTWILIMPLNIYFSKRYAAAQGRIMKARDEKLGVVTEALQGLRQLKFMGIEKQWQEKILSVRIKELGELWKSFKADTMLMFCWIASPVFLSAASLAVYALIYGELTPSVAFTSIGVFKQLEVTLAVIPELSTMLIDAYISVKRIEAYLDAPEISLNTKDSPSISFEVASVAWPSDEEKEDGDQRYVLRNLNVSFPNKELSIISGKTGTGKSLLLAAILGEVDLLSGSINVPKPPSIYDRHDSKATKDNWIIPSSIAYVAQIPWIENASIKDNILFGLPFDEHRYNKTLEVCALRKDLDMLPDGESTEIGANGINLSGGQRWRVTFARALYSRAGILVLDDIFSAVDAHVGRFIFEQGLTGELGAGRTRILVTHHVALVKSRAKYLVELGDGTVEHEGLLSELEEDGVLTKILSHEQTGEEIQEDEEATAVNSEESSDGESSGEVLAKINTKNVAKKFVEDETKEKGAVSKAVYLSYIRASGGWTFWAFIIMIFLLQQAITLGM